MSDSLDDWGGTEFVLAADRLDTPDVIEAADPGDMLRQVASAAAQVRTALRSCREADLSAFTPDARPRAIVVAGLGGAGLAGELLGAVAGPSSPVQVVATQAERLPGWVGAADVVIAASGSGTMAETLSVAAEAARRGCRLVVRRARGLGAAAHRRAGPGPVHPGRRGRPARVGAAALDAVGAGHPAAGHRRTPRRGPDRAGGLRAGGHPARGGLAPVPAGQRVVRQPGQVPGPGPGRHAAGGVGDVGAERGRRAAVRRPAQRQRQVPGDRGPAARGGLQPDRGVRRAVRPRRPTPGRP